MTDILSWFIIPAAVTLDLLIGDPQNTWHPIRWMGNAISFLEPKFRQLPVSAKVTGALLVFVLIPAAWSLAWLVIAIAGLIHPLAGWIAEILLIYFSISARALDQAAMAVYRPLAGGRVEQARHRLSFIVGRDVTRLSDRGIARAAVETVAENLVDGVIAPLFYAAIGGAPLAMAYKMINTLDSMVGYKTEPYRDFGMVAARVDDVANFIPARISVPVISIAAWCVSGKGRSAFQTAALEGRQHASPNAGFPEAAFAGVLGIRLGGPNIYHDERVDKPWIGKRFGPAGPAHVKQACDLMLLSAVIWAGGSSIAVSLSFLW